MSQTNSNSGSVPRGVIISCVAFEILAICFSESPPLGRPAGQAGARGGRMNRNLPYLQIAALGVGALAIARKRLSLSSYAVWNGSRSVGRILSGAR
jgi:hypothetical protein